jgi:hypothetical protein
MEGCQGQTWLLNFEGFKKKKFKTQSFFNSTYVFANLCSVKLSIICVCMWDWRISWLILFLTWQAAIFNPCGFGKLDAMYVLEQWD